MQSKDPQLARETEQLEPEHVRWMLERGYARKDKQATRMTIEGLLWLRGVEVWTTSALNKLVQSTPKRRTKILPKTSGE